MEIIVVRCKIANFEEKLGILVEATQSAYKWTLCIFMDKCACANFVAIMRFCRFSTLFSRDKQKTHESKKMSTFRKLLKGNP